MGMHFIFESGVLGMVMILASKITILGLETNTSGMFSREIGRLAWPDPNPTPVKVWRERQREWEDND